MLSRVVCGWVHPDGRVFPAHHRAVVGGPRPKVLRLIRDAATMTTPFLAALWLQYSFGWDLRPILRRRVRVACTKLPGCLQRLNGGTITYCDWVLTGVAGLDMIALDAQSPEDEAAERLRLRDATHLAATLAATRYPTDQQANLPLWPIPRGRGPGFVWGTSPPWSVMLATSALVDRSFCPSVPSCAITAPRDVLFRKAPRHASKRAAASHLRRVAAALPAPHASAGFETLFPATSDVKGA